DNLSTEQWAGVDNLLTEFADIFALSVSEVCAVVGGEHRLNIKPSVTFSTKVQHRRITPSAQANLDATLNSLLAADVLRSINVKDIKCCSPVKMAQKAH
ncbi:hypothetical protein FIBSPDRAFT_665004, partial [Athelia psychrophila]